MRTLIVMAIVFQCACQQSVPVGYMGNPHRGQRLVTAYGCTACHVIPGAWPQGAAGPPLTRFGSRSYIAGRFTNEPIMLQQWIRHPQQMKPGTAMPDLSVGERDARDIAAYLGRLR